MRFLPILATAVSLVAITPPVLAQQQGQDGPRVPVTAANVEQKAKFVTNLVTNSASIRAIEQSGDADAIQALQNARKLVDEAVKDSAAGNAAQADVKLNKAIELVNSNTRRVSESTIKGNRAQQLFESRMASVKALLEAYDRVAKEKGVASRTGERRAAVVQHISEIEAMAKGGNYEGAVVQLDQAYATVTAELSALREGDKLTKELSFASAEEEYVYEIDRNDSHVFLLKLTLSEKPPHPSFAATIEGMRTEAEDLRKQAEAKAKSKDFAGAIKALGESTDKLIKALRMGGAYIPG